MESSTDQPSLFRLTGTTLALEVHQDDACAGGYSSELEWLRDRMKTFLVIKSSPIMGPGSTYSCLKATRHYTDDDTIQIMPRESYTKDILKELSLQYYNPVPTPIVRTRREEDLGTPLLSPVDRTSFHRCVGIA